MKPGKVKSAPTKKPRKRDREESRKCLLAAGIHIFSKCGYDAATTKMVARRAGINESLISRYFKSKAGLLLDIMKAFIESEDKDCNYPPGDTLEQEIGNFFQERMEHFQLKRDFMRVVVSRMIVDSKLSREMNKHICKGGMPRLTSRLREFQNHGLIHADADIEGATFAISAQAFAMGFFSHIALGMEEAHVRKALDEFARVYARGLA